MHIAEIIMLIVGAVLFTVSFFMPDKGSNSSKLDKEEEKRQINRLLEDQSDDVIQKINDAAQECVSDNRERMERAMERVSNEKIIAINEYSDTVLEEIKKNHDEVVFLYDMLNNKQSQIKNTAAELSQLTRSAKEVAAKESTAREVSGTEANLASAKDNSAINGNAYDENKGFGYVSPKSNRESTDMVFGYTVSNHEKKKEVPFEELSVTEVSPEDSKVINDSFERNAAKNSISTNDVTERNVSTNNLSENSASTKKSKKETVKTPVADGSLDLMFASDNNSVNNNDRILELHKAGKSNMAIAKELGLGIGEVKLVIDLFEGI